MTAKRFFGELALAAAIFTVAGVLFSRLAHAAASGDPVIIKMWDDGSSYKFDPQNVTIKVGQTVEWQNVGQNLHDATDDPSLAPSASDVASPAGSKPFDSEFVRPSESFRYTFTVPGVYKYVCIPHEKMGMGGEITVR